MSNPLLDEDFGERLATDLTAISRMRRSRLAGDDDALPLAEGAERMLASGKRLRPAFAYWTWRACGGGRAGEGASGVIRAGAALELFQAAALVHDDLIDDSPLRRGIDSTHRYFAALHAGQGHLGPAEAHGRAGAILLGDLLLLESEEAFASALACFEAGPAAAARSAFTQMCSDVTVGQYLDIEAEARGWGEPAAELERARRVIQLKSASYSVLGPVRIGAVLQGAPAAQLASLEQFGAAAGEAFQLRDDLLGVFGSQDTTGKPAGDDLREGKHTVLVALALAALPSSRARELRDGIGSRELDSTGVMRLTNLISSSGAPEECEKMIARLRSDALGQLEAAGLGQAGHTQLMALTEAALHRDA